MQHPILTSQELQRLSMTEDVGWYPIMRGGSTPFSPSHPVQGMPQDQIMCYVHLLVTPSSDAQELLQPSTSMMSAVAVGTPPQIAHNRVKSRGMWRRAKLIIPTPGDELGACWSLQPCLLSCLCSEADATDLVRVIKCGRKKTCGEAFRPRSARCQVVS